MAIALLAKVRSLHTAAIQYLYIVLTLPQIIPISSHTYVSCTVHLEPALTYLSCNIRRWTTISAYQTSCPMGQCRFLSCWWPCLHVAVEPTKIICLAYWFVCTFKCTLRFALLSKYPSHSATTDLQMSNTCHRSIARFLNWAKTQTCMMMTVSCWSRGPAHWTTWKS